MPWSRSIPNPSSSVWNAFQPPAAHTSLQEAPSRTHPQHTSPRCHPSARNSPGSRRRLPPSAETRDQCSLCPHTAIPQETSRLVSSELLLALPRAAFRWLGSPTAVAVVSTLSYRNKRVSPGRGIRRRTNSIRTPKASLEKNRWLFLAKAQYTAAPHLQRNFIRLARVPVADSRSPRSGAPYAPKKKESLWTVTSLAWLL